MSASLIIATRESPLALWQANWVKARLEHHHPGLEVHLLGLTTRGDQITEGSLLKEGGKNVFVKELEEALLEGRADLAVHSMKDVPMILPSGLCLPVMCEREDPRDAFIANAFTSFRDLPQHAQVGTSSLRRRSQLLALRHDIQTKWLRGNVNTRLMKLDSGEYDAIILAAAGLKRLNLGDRIKSYLDIDESLPAAGQGVLGLECRENDEKTKALLMPLYHAESVICVTAERALCRTLNSGCQAPVAAYAELEAGKIRLKGLVASPDGKKIVRAEGLADSDRAESLGQQVAMDLIQQGADKLLSALREE